ncbi:MAG: hypothetical protein H6R10_706 [Rhodocyclaceae bacterium]|nr:hypothetical protein [Rhodocyclaceae bacterium]
MTKNYLQEGDVLDLVAPYAVAAGDGAQVGSIFGVAINALALSESGPFARCGVFELTALSTATGAQGAKAYWDNVNKRVDTDSTVGLLIGALLAAKTNGQTTAQVVLNEGVPSTAEGPQAAIVSLTDSTGAATNDSTLADGLTITAITDNSGGAAGDTIAAATNTDALTDSTGGAANTTLEAVGATNGGDVSGAINNNFADLAAQLAKQRSLNTVLINAVASLAAKVNTGVTDLTTQNQNDSDIAAKLNTLLTELRAAGIIAA